MAPNRASMWQESAQADSFQQMVAGVYKGMSIHTGTPGHRDAAPLPHGKADVQEEWLLSKQHPEARHPGVLQSFLGALAMDSMSLMKDLPLPH